MTAPDELETTLLEWAREFSEPTIRQSEDRTVTIEWGVRGWSNCTKVADELIDEWVADKNRIVALEADVARLTAERDALKEGYPPLRDRASYQGARARALNALAASIAADPLHTHNTPEPQ